MKSSIIKPMKQAIFLLLISTSTLWGCNTEKNSPSIEIDTVIHSNSDVSTLIDTSALNINLIPKGEYATVKLEIQTSRKTKNSKADFENYLLNQIIPHWYGTEWDFNGYTSIPNQGVIACGYFVSTTLEHVGIVINRYHLAQQAGTNEAKSLAIVDSNYFTVYGIDKLQRKMKEYDDGIYFVGLDNHVGYLYKESGVLYFIHSNYIDDKVMIEKAEFSKAFQSSIYVVAEISTNELLLERWRKNQRVDVIRN